MTINQKTTNAELLFVNFLVEHNLPIAIADHAGDLFCKMFPDSEIASQFKCGRTKARKLVGAIAKEKTEEITEYSPLMAAMIKGLNSYTQSCWDTTMTAKS